MPIMADLRSAIWAGLSCLSFTMYEDNEKMNINLVLASLVGARRRLGAIRTFAGAKARVILLCVFGTTQVVP
jgi:hypothetical protein